MSYTIKYLEIRIRELQALVVSLRQYKDMYFKAKEREAKLKAQVEELKEQLKDYDRLKKILQTIGTQR